MQFHPGRSGGCIVLCPPRYHRIDVDLPLQLSTANVTSCLVCRRVAGVVIDKRLGLLPLTCPSMPACQAICKLHGESRHRGFESVGQLALSSLQTL